VGFSRNTSDSI